eukprot:TRINITY_DN18523_c0_g1_i1.p1 TRINITY_DN18523_c0_g1~~TRINITY_DN18523_c0_g1_i1.p1  ORF type:complete len:407 (-),score=95.71 TRINITY_DN18523_c0_g1_i1:169-1389(-)
MTSTGLDELAFSQDKKRYIADTLNPMLEEMLVDVITEMPERPLDFMIPWLQKRCGHKASQHDKLSVIATNAALKRAINHAMSLLEEAGQTVATSQDEQEKEEVEEEEDEEVDEIPARKSDTQQKSARKAVSAESFTVDKDFQPPIHAKTEGQKQRLRETLLHDFMFNTLDSKDMDVLLAAMKEVTLQPGQEIITEGDDGDFLFVVESGNLDCVKTIDGQKQVVKTCSQGDIFGDLALLYSCPRSASVISKDTAVCWQLDRGTFNFVVRDSTVKRREKYEAFLRSVPIMNGLSDVERSQICDALKQEVHQKGASIITQGDPGDKFYIVEEGYLVATKALKDGSEESVMNYRPGDYFGELALLNNQPRAATVSVTSDSAKVLSMTRVAFRTMLGPLQDILARGVSTYI